MFPSPVPPHGHAGGPRLLLRYNHRTGKLASPSVASALVLSQKFWLHLWSAHSHKWYICLPPPAKFREHRLRENTKMVKNRDWGEPKQDSALLDVASLLLQLWLPAQICISSQSTFWSGTGVEEGVGLWGGCSPTTLAEELLVVDGFSEGRISFL